MGIFGPPRIPKGQRAQPRGETKEDKRAREVAEKRAMAHKRNLKAKRAAEARKRAIKTEDSEPTFYETVTVDKWGKEHYKRESL